VATELLVGLQVNDRALYQQYRDAMRPLLEQHQGGFSSDFWVEQSLLPQHQGVNRLFTIYFASEALCDQFFSHPDYLAIKQQFFSTSVHQVFILAKYETA